MKQTFSAKLMAAFAPRKRVPVYVTVNGYSFRTTIADMGLPPRARRGD